MKKFLRLLRGKTAESEKNNKDLNGKTDKTMNDSPVISSEKKLDISDKKSGVDFNDLNDGKKMISSLPILNSKSSKFITGTNSTSEIMMKDRSNNNEDGVIDIGDDLKYLKDLRESITSSEKSKESKELKSCEGLSDENLSDRDNGSTSSLPRNKNGKHLICDDSEPNRMVLSKYLTRKNYVIEETNNGLEAIEKITKSDGEYYVVWMDIMMPRMNGMDCTKTLRQKHGYKGVIIGLTGYIDQDSINQCYKLGMNHVIGKPIDKGTLYHYAEKYTHPTTYKVQNTPATAFRTTFGNINTSTTLGTAKSPGIIPIDTPIVDGETVKLKLIK